MTRCARWTAIAAAALLAAGCGGRQVSTTASGTREVVNIVARGLTFEAPEEVPSGWNTFRFANASGMTHFALIERLPAGVGVEEQQEQVAPVFQAGMDLLDKGKPQEAMKKFGELPDWFKQVVITGGPGLTAPGDTSETTVQLDPGIYMLECYVKTNGVFHSFSPDSGVFGMVHEFMVTDAPSNHPEPEATVHLTLSSARGIEMEGAPVAGPQTVSVHFEDQKVYGNFVGHDVHLVRLKPDTDLDTLAAWMDWTKKGGLQTPAPAEFLGGVNEMPAGSTAYLDVNLTPGRYAWIAEVPDPQKIGFLKVFEVPAGS